MERKEILKQGIESIVVEHENRLNNCDDFANLIASQIISKMETNIPDIMEKLKSSRKTVRVSASSSSRWSSIKSWNKFDKKLDVPREILDFDAEHMDNAEQYDKEVSLYELLTYQIKGMVVPILLQNYSFLVGTDQMPFAEYCVQRIDDPNFVSQISNLVYAKKLFDTKESDSRKKYLATNNLENNITDLLQMLYKYETGINFAPDRFSRGNRWGEIRDQIHPILEETIMENDETIRQSTHKTELSIFTIISKMFNEKRQEMGFPTYSLRFDDITSYSTLLSELEKETEELRGLDSYSSSKYYHTPFEQNVSGNGFFYGNGDFVRIEKEEDSLIESIKDKIDFKEIHDGRGNTVGWTGAAFSYYGWNNDPIYNAQPITASMVSANKSFLSSAKVLLADMVISQYAKKQDNNQLAQADATKTENNGRHI